MDCARKDCTLRQSGESSSATICLIEECQFRKKLLGIETLIKPPRFMPPTIDYKITFSPCKSCQRFFTERDKLPCSDCDYRLMKSAYHR